MSITNEFSDNNEIVDYLSRIKLKNLKLDNELRKEIHEELSLVNVNYDCSEISEDILDIVGRDYGFAFILESVAGLLRIPENGDLKEYEYHSLVLVYLEGDPHVWDYRIDNEPIELEDWIKILENDNDLSLITIREDEVAND